ncbi:MAG TPA: hypothetical protein DHU96_28855 [Actinobacteria bacterium]|nr:hypothetical protein [Actinomycetota bacterium]
MAGRLDRKRTTFTDFIAVADGLAADGWVAGDSIVSRGLSAGGLLQGSVFSMAPRRWRAAVAEVPSWTASTRCPTPPSRSPSTSGTSGGIRATRPPAPTWSPTAPMTTCRSAGGRTCW